MIDLKVDEKYKIRSVQVDKQALEVDYPEQPKTKIWILLPRIGESDFWHKEVIIGCILKVNTVDGVVTLIATENKRWELYSG